MKLKDSYSFTDSKPCSIPSAVETICDPRSYGDGELERLRNAKNETIALVGRLVETLFKSDKLSKEEVLHIFGKRFEEAE